MNPVIDQMLAHRSIRKYSDRPVSDEVLREILEAGIMASSSGNMQAYSIIVTQAAEVREALFDAHFRQSMVREAPVLMTFCADFHRMRRWLKLSQAPDGFDNFMSFMIGAIDAILVAQNVALAAESVGLGICFMGTTLASCKEVARILGCPENVVPVVGFSLGYPAEKPELRTRFPLEGLVHRETYHRYSDAEIGAIYRERENSGWKRYMESAELRERVLRSGVENLAQVYTKLKYTSESHVTYSKDVIDCLIAQNFISRV